MQTRVAAALMLFVQTAVTLPEALAAELALPIALDYRILEKALDEQLFSGPARTAEVYADSIRCNTLVLSGPGVGGAEGGLIRITAQVDSRVGTPLGERCPLAFEWRGVIETLQEAYVDTDTSTVAFRVVDSTLLKPDAEDRAAPDIVWRWIKDYVHPRFEAVTLNLAPAVSGMEELIGLALRDRTVQTPPVTPSIRLESVTPMPDSLDIVLLLDLPDPPPGWQPTTQEVLTPEELARWDAAWQAWDGFATWLIKTLAVTAEPELADALAETLLEARYDLRDAVAVDDRTRDPVRELFLKTWERLAPLLHETRLAIPGVQALHYATFVSAADALRTLDSAAPHLGMRLDSDSLRSLARLLVPTVPAEDLDYGTEVDPALRKLFGLEPEFAEEESDVSLPFAWLIPPARAGQISPALVQKLTGWVPALNEIDEYLRTMARLLDEVSAAERRKGKVSAKFLGIYDALLRATAWQETCWRQYVDVNGTVRPIISSAGSIGLMQVNKYVWRGVYDITSLNSNVGYNARAGNEILVHYLVDLAIKKKEHRISGDPHNLARAAYAVYNGGPRHLTRYRSPRTGASLKAIDEAFWKKYQAIRKHGAGAVKQCYGA